MSRHRSKKRAGWVRCGGKLTVHGVWVHDSGWIVRHCGHPTALWPYYIQTPKGRMIVAPNGQGFTHLDEAQIAVEKKSAKTEKGGSNNTAPLAKEDTGANHRHPKKQRENGAIDTVHPTLPPMRNVAPIVSPRQHVGLNEASSPNSVKADQLAKAVPA